MGERYEHERDDRWPERVTPVLCRHCERMYEPDDRECPVRLRQALDAMEARALAAEAEVARLREVWNDAQIRLDDRAFRVEKAEAQRDTAVARALAERDDAIAYGKSEHEEWFEKLNENVALAAERDAAVSALAQAREACQLIRMVALPPTDVSGRAMWDKAEALLRALATAEEKPRDRGEP